LALWLDSGSPLPLLDGILRFIDKTQAARLGASAGTGQEAPQRKRGVWRVAPSRSATMAAQSVRTGAIHSDWGGGQGWRRAEAPASRIDDWTLVRVIGGPAMGDAGPALSRRRSAAKKLL
jgi:hypothetical protein